MDEGNSIIVRLLASADERAALIDLFEAVANEESWQPGDALRTASCHSHYLGAWVHGELVGGVQISLPDALGTLPFQTVWPEVTLDHPSRSAHLTVLAIRRQHRGNPALFWSLCAELWRFLITNGMEAAVLETTPAMFARYSRLGFPLERIGDLRLHWGEDCYLCRMDLRMVAGAMLMQAGKSPMYRTLIGQVARSKRQPNRMPRSARL